MTKTQLQEQVQKLEETLKNKEHLLAIDESIIDTLKKSKDISDKLIASYKRTESLNNEIIEKHISLQKLSEKLYEKKLFKQSIIIYILVCIVIVLGITMIANF